MMPSPSQSPRWSISIPVLLACAGAVAQTAPSDDARALIDEIVDAAGAYLAPVGDCPPAVPGEPSAIRALAGWDQPDTEQRVRHHIRGRARGDTVVEDITELRSAPRRKHLQAHARGPGKPLRERTIGIRNHAVGRQEEVGDQRMQAMCETLKRVSQEQPDLDIPLIESCEIASTAEELHKIQSEQMAAEPEKGQD